MGLLVALSSLTLFLSYNYMAAGIASTLLFVYPIMVALIMAMVFKEKLALQTIVCMLLALGGIGLLYKSEDGSTLSLIGTLLVFASSLSYAIYIVGINQTSLKKLWLRLKSPSMSFSSAYRFLWHACSIPAY